MKIYSIILFLIAGLTIGCQEQPETIDTEIASKEIRSAWDGFIERWEDEDAKACAGYYTESAVNIPPSFKANKGRQEIEEFYKFLFDNNLSSDYKHTINQLDFAGNHAFEMGQFEVHWTRNDSTEWTYYARTMAHWKKNDEGEWKIDKFLFNNPPAEEPPN